MIYRIINYFVIYLFDHPIDVYSTQSYNAMLEKKKQQKLERMNRYAAKQAEEEDYEEEDIVPSAPPVEESESEKILLKLRGKDKKDITLRVRPVSALHYMHMSKAGYA